MAGMIHNIWETYLQYNGGGGHMALFLCALLLLGALCRTEREKSDSFLLSGYAVFFFGIFFCPLTAKVIMDFCIGARVYWRMFWILPLPAVIAYAFALRLKKAEVSWKRGAVVAGMILVVAVTGTSIYAQGNFREAENLYKIPQDAVDVCELMQEDAERHNIEDKGIIVVNELLPYIRQYDGTVRMPYGRLSMHDFKFPTKNGRKIYNLINNPQIDFKRLKKAAQKGGYNYLAYYRHGMPDQEMRELGFEKIGESSNYFVYRIEI